jgi:pyruvate,orthophosphate dikinase
MATLLFRGVGASPGRARGPIVFTAEAAILRTAEGPVLVRADTNNEDTPGIRAASALLTTHGGVTGDGAIVARALGKPCIASAAGVRVDYAARTVTVRSPNGERDLAEGDILTVDGTKGEAFVD